MTPPNTKYKYDKQIDKESGWNVKIQDLTPNTLGSFLIGAKVYFRKEDNPLTDLANGIIRFYITYLAPPPAETIEYILEVDVTYFNNLFGGE